MNLKKTIKLSQKYVLDDYLLHRIDCDFTL